MWMSVHWKTCIQSLHRISLASFLLPAWNDCLLSSPPNYRNRMIRSYRYIQLLKDNYVFAEKRNLCVVSQKRTWLPTSCSWIHSYSTSNDPFRNKIFTKHASFGQAFLPQCFNWATFALRIREWVLPVSLVNHRYYRQLILQLDHFVIAHRVMLTFFVPPFCNDSDVFHAMCISYLCLVKFGKEYRTLFPLALQIIL